MSVLPPSPFVVSVVAVERPPTEAPAAASPSPQASDAAVDRLDPLVEYVDLDQIDCIGEIFAGARKLEPAEMWFENSAYPREDELLYEVFSVINNPQERGLAHIPDAQAFFDAIEPPPLFLQAI